MNLKQPMVPLQGLSIAQTRTQQLVAACRPVYRFTLAVHLAAIMRTLVSALTFGQGLPQTAADLGNVLPSLAITSLPMMVIQLGRLDLLEATCATAHILQSCVLWSIAAGLVPVPAPTAARVILETHAEMVISPVFTFQYQLSLPIMAVLHAIHQAGWMAIILWRLDGDLHRCVVRGGCNWVLMMLLSSFLEMRIRAAHRQAVQAVQQQQQQHKQQDLDGLSEPSCIRSHLLESAAGMGTDRMGSKKLTPAACKLDEGSSSRSHIGHGFSEPAEGPAAYRGAALSAGTMRGGLPGECHATTAHRQAPELTMVTAAAPLIALQGQGTGLSAGKTAAIQAQLTPGQQSAARALYQVMEQGHTLPYKRKRAGRLDTVHVKLKDIELEQLPSDLPKLLQEQLSYCMPGVTMTGLALRSGCVIMTLDLEQCAGDADGAISADDMAGLITRLMQSLPVEHVPGDGATMSIQTSDELALCRWDTAMEGYTPEGAPAVDSADVAPYRMISAEPAIHCLSGNPAHMGQQAGCSTRTAAYHQLTLTVKLELPGNCQLHGWQPAGVVASAGSDELLRDSLQDSPEVDAMLLARRLDGGYLPVVVERVSHQIMATGNAMMHRTNAQVIVTLEGGVPAMLHLEFWCKQADTAGSAVGGTGSQSAWVPGHMPGLELLVSHAPLLVLPSSWKEAAAELLQHVDSIGGVQPLHALDSLALISDSASSLSNANKHSPGDQDSDVESLDGTPPAASQQVGSRAQVHNAQPAQHRRNPKASDSASSHTFPHIQPPSDDVDSDPAGSLLADLGAFLTHHYPSAGAALTHQSAAGPDTATSQLGSDLLVYAVRRGLGAVAGIIVDTMQRAEQQWSAGTAGMPTLARPSAWLPRVAGSTPNSMDSDEELSGGDGRRLSLLHAAMLSGCAEMLGHVFRWGALYGGPEWAWPWQLEDAAGCTALHLAAAQPAAGACAALLKTITCMLPAAQVQAARNAWLHGQGGMSTTPAELYALASHGGTVGAVWGHQTLVSSRLSATSTQPDAAYGSTRPGPSPTSTSGLPHRTVTLVTPRPWAKARRWLRCMLVVWTMRETNEYRAWSRHQDLLPIWYWAAAMFVIAATATWRSAAEGCLQHEFMHLAFHTWGMIPVVVATAGGNRWLGGSQAGMLLAHVLPICSWIAKSRLSSHQAPIWIASARTGAEVIYVLLLGVAVDQIPMQQLVMVRAVEAIFQSIAYMTAGTAYAVPRALATHSIALAVSMVLRTRKLRAFYRWHNRRQGCKRRDSSSSSGGEVVRARKRPSLDRGVGNAFALR